jgi:hypothetical protein
VRDFLVEAQDALAGFLIADREEEDDDQQAVKKEQEEHEPAPVVHAQFASDLGEPTAGEPAFRLQWGPGHSCGRF